MARSWSSFALISARLASLGSCCSSTFCLADAHASLSPWVVFVARAGTGDDLTSEGGEASPVIFSLKRAHSSRSWAVVLCLLIVGRSLLGGRPVLEPSGQQRLPDCEASACGIPRRYGGGRVSWRWRRERGSWTEPGPLGAGLWGRSYFGLLTTWKSSFRILGVVWYLGEDSFCRKENPHRSSLHLYRHYVKTLSTGHLWGIRSWLVTS